MPLGFARDTFPEVSRVDDIVIYRQGNTFHAVHSATNKVISRNITFDHINQVMEVIESFIVNIFSPLLIH